MKPKEETALAIAACVLAILFGCALALAALTGCASYVDVPPSGGADAGPPRSVPNNCPPDDECVRWFDSGDSELGCFGEFASAGVPCDRGTQTCDGRGACGGLP